MRKTEIARPRQVIIVMRQVNQPCVAFTHRTTANTTQRHPRNVSSQQVHPQTPVLLPVTHTDRLARARTPAISAHNVSRRRVTAPAARTATRTEIPASLLTARLSAQHTRLLAMLQMTRVSSHRPTRLQNPGSRRPILHRGAAHRAKLARTTACPSNEHNTALLANYLYHAVNYTPARSIALPSICPEGEKAIRAGGTA